MKKFVVIALLIFLFLIGGSTALVAENEHSGHSGPSTGIQSGEHSSHDAALQQSNDVLQPSHGEHQSNEPSQSSTGHGQSQGTSSTEHSSHDRQAQNQDSEAHDGGHGVKEVKEVNIKPWVYAFLAYTAGVLLLALVLKKGRGKNNELVS